MATRELLINSKYLNDTELYVIFNSSIKMLNLYIQNALRPIIAIVQFNHRYRNLRVAQRLDDAYVQYS